MNNLVEHTRIVEIANEILGLTENDAGILLGALENAFKQVDRKSKGNNGKKTERAQEKVEDAENSSVAPTT
jgi:hypothetical protein